MPDHAEQPWTPPVHDITAGKADLPLYNRLYAATEALAQSRLQEHLQTLTFQSVARDTTESLRALLKFVSQDPDAPAGFEGQALEAIDPEALDALSSSLEAHLQKTPHTRQRERAVANRRVAEQMAAELARSMWSTLLDHAARHAQAGVVVPERLLPAYPEGGVTNPLHNKLLGDLVHFGLPLEALVWLSHATLERLAAADGAAAVLQLAQRLSVSKPELRRFLEAQKQKQARAQEAVVTTTPASSKKQPALSTQQIRAW